MVIDCHVHVLDHGHWPDEWYDWAALQWASRAPGRRPEDVRPKVEPGIVDPDGSRMLAAMDAAGIGAAVVLPMDWGPDFAERIPPDQISEHAAGLAAAHPGRFIPFVGIDPRRPGAADLVEGFLRKRRARGLKLYPSSGWDPYDQSARPLYELCQDLDVPVLFHTGETLPLLSLRYANPVLLNEVHANFPRLVTMIGHAGARLWWDEALAVAAASVNGHLELSAWIWEDTGDDEKEALVRRIAAARDRIGIERLLFGTDTVSGRRVRGDHFMQVVTDWFHSLPEQAARLGLGFTPEEMELLMGGNAARILRVAA